MTPAPPLVVLLLLGAALLGAGCLIGAQNPRDVIARIRGRLLVASGAGALLLLACFAVQSALPQLLGLPVVVGPTLAAAASVLLFSVVPIRASPRTGRREASLRPRSSSALVAEPAAVLAGVPVVALVALLVATGLTADPDGRGLSRTVPGYSGTAGPYPGWFYAVPLGAAVLLLAVTVALALRRATLLPAVDGDELDLRWRRAAARSVLSLATAAVLLDLAGTGWAAGGALAVLGRVARMNGVPADPLALALAPFTGTAVQLSALGAVAAFIVAVVQAASIGRAPRRRAVAA